VGALTRPFCLPSWPRQKSRTLSDLWTRRYGGAYNTGATATSDTEIKLQLTPKADRSTPYSKIEALLRKDMSLPTELKYTSTDGKVSKTEARTSYSCEGEVCAPLTRKMTNNTTGLWTTITRKMWKVNQAIPDSIFAKKNLDS
jgi:hypothetical protein